jgi:hypothetical protein
MNDEEIWEMEQRLWLDGPEVYQRSMDPACVMAFPGMGVMKAADVIESLKQAPRWSSVQMEDRTIGRAGKDVVAIAYRAVGQREEADPYRCLCTSTYRRKDDHWLLVQHQQTPDDQ